MLEVCPSIRSRNGAPSRKGCVVNGQMTKASKQQISTPPLPSLVIRLRPCTTEYPPPPSSPPPSPAPSPHLPGNHQNANQQWPMPKSSIFVVNFSPLTFLEPPNPSLYYFQVILYKQRFLVVKALSLEGVKTDLPFSASGAGPYLLAIMATEFYFFSGINL